MLEHTHVYTRTHTHTEAHVYPTANSWKAMI